MTQRDYILRMFEEIGRAMAQIIYKRQMKEYEAAYALLDEQFKQSLGMGRGFIHSISDEALLSLLGAIVHYPPTSQKKENDTTRPNRTSRSGNTYSPRSPAPMDYPSRTLNIEKCWLVATLLKAEGEIYEDQLDENHSYSSFLKACNLFLEALYDQYGQREIEPAQEIEALLGRLENYELPWRSMELLFWYFERTGRYSKAEDMLFDLLETESSDEEERDALLEKGEAFYARLFLKSEEALAAGNLSHEEITESLTRLHTITPG